MADRPDAATNTKAAERLLDEILSRRPKRSVLLHVVPLTMENFGPTCDAFRCPEGATDLGTWHKPQIVLYVNRYYCATHAEAAHKLVGMQPSDG